MTEIAASPVALFLFNRPHATQRVFESIARARPGHLLVIADGPRADRTGEAALCREARAVIERVDWPCRVQTLFSERNLGCRRRVATGLDWVFSQTECAIILEDDCLPSPDFFPFCDELLERHRSDERVHMIRGSNFLGVSQPTVDSYYFSRFFNIWGWASWARAWSHYDVDMRQWPQLRDRGWLEERLEPEMAALVRYFFDETHAGRIDTWDYQWMLSGWIRNALAAVPTVNLVANIGHGEGATHTGNAASPLAALPAGRLGFPLRHPAEVRQLAEADEREWNRVYPGQRVRRGWRRLLRKALT